MKFLEVKAAHRTAFFSLLGICMVGGGALASGFVVPGSRNYSVATPAASSTVEEVKKPTLPVVEHVSIPTAVKGVYMSQCAAGSETFRADYFKQFKNTELNTVVLDLKDYSGTVSFPSDTALPGSGCTVSDFREFVKELHANNVFVIGRMTVFQDPLYTKHHPDEAVKRASDTSLVWKDRKGLSFVDVGSKPFWDYIVTLSREAVMLGVDEINYDYIRYPSDGDMKDVYYSHSEGTPPEQLEHFFVYLTDKMRTPSADGYVPKLSVDLFGMTATNEDDLNIGQQLERAMPYFDFIYPMVYPSHYPSGFHGYKNVNANAYGIVNFSMKVAAARTLATSTPIGSFAYTPIASASTSSPQATSPKLYAKPSYDAQKIRPWLQSFDYPVDYTPAMVQEQIQATYDAGLTGWLFWDAANRYTSLKQVLQPKSQ